MINLYLKALFLFIVFIAGTSFGFSAIQDDVFEMRLAGYIAVSSIPMIFYAVLKGLLKETK